MFTPILRKEFCRELLYKGPLLKVCKGLFLDNLTTAECRLGQKSDGKLEISDRRYNEINGAPRAIRTPDPQIRSLTKDVESKGKNQQLTPKNTVPGQPVADSVQTKLD